MDSDDEVLRRADSALFQAKADGIARVVTAAPAGASPSAREAALLDR